MQLISKFNKGFRFLLCVIDIFGKYTWVVPLKDREGISIINAFRKILKESDKKPNKMWVDKGSEFHNNYFKKWLKDNDIEMYSIQNERKSVVAEKFIRTLKAKIYKYMTAISKNVYIDKLDDMVNEYNNTYRTIKMKPVAVKDNTYIDFEKEVLIIKIQNLKLVIMSEFLNTKIFLLKDTTNHATKTGIKNISHVDTSSSALKTSLANLKSEVDKLVPVPVDLSKLSDVVKNDVVKKDVYDKLVTKVNNINTSRFVLKLSMIQINQN